MPAPSPLTANADLLSFALKAGGADLGERYEILSLSVALALNRIPSATIVVRDGDAAQERFAASAGNDFAPGAKIEVFAGYHDDTQKIFTGVIVKSSIQVRHGGESTCTLVCRDAAIAMTTGRQSGCYTDTKDSDVITTLITRHTLTADVAATAEKLEELTQFAASDWDFMLARAEANGLVVYVSAGTVSVKPPVLTGEPVLSVTYGFDVLQADLEADARTQFSAVKCAAWDPATQALVTATERPKNANPLGSDTPAKLAKIANADPTSFQTAAPLKPETLQAWAKAQLLKAELAKIRGTVQFPGSARALPGKLIELDGFGSRFDGKGYVSGIVHELRPGEWTTTATIGLDPEWFATRPDVNVPPASALLPAVPGLQIGTVSKIHEDPTGEFRVLVEIPTVGPAGKGIWARLASPYATKKAGMFFYPEVGDEVVLAFLDADPRFPVILGGLHSSSHTPPFTPDQKNIAKAIVTNSQLKLHFDDEKKIITVETPAGNKAEFNDDQKSIMVTDQTGNCVKLETGGITLTSKGDVTITAEKNVTIEAKTGTLTAKGTNGASVSGLKVELSADTEFSATGGASAALSSSGQTTVKGAMVMIN